jgi:hypothetical protein
MRNSATAIARPDIADPKTQGLTESPSKRPDVQRA